MNGSRRVLLRDVADRAGLSLSSVSQILNGRRGHLFSDQTRRRVQKLAAELGYVPHPAAQWMARRGHATSTQRRLEFVCTTASMDQDVLRGLEFFVPVIEGMKWEAEQHGVDVSVVSGVGTGNELREYLSRQYQGARAAGFVLSSLLDREIADFIAAERLPAVYIGDSTPHPHAICCIYGDNVEGGRLATRHLLELGHRRIAYLGDLERADLLYEHQRLAGYLLEHIAARLSPDPALIGSVASVASVEPVLDRLLSLDEAPTALFAATQPVAMQALTRLRQLELSVPQQISLVSFDNTSISDYVTPALTAVNVPRRQIGAEACRRVLQLAANPSLPPLTTLLPVELVVRQSCAPRPLGAQALRSNA